MVFCAHFQLTFNSNKQQRICQTTEYCIAALVLTYLQFISIKIRPKVPKFTQRHWCLCSPILFCSVSKKLAFAMTWSFCFFDQHVRLTCRRSKNVLSDEGQFVINVHSVVVPEQKFIVSESSEVASLTPPILLYLDNWLPVPESMLCDILWAKNLVHVLS